MNSIISSENLIESHEDLPIDTDLTVKPTTCYMCTYDCPTDAFPVRKIAQVMIT